MLKEEVERRRGLRKEGSRRINYLCRNHEFPVTPLLMGPVLLISQGRFEEPVRPWLRVYSQSE